MTLKQQKFSIASRALGAASNGGARYSPRGWHGQARKYFSGHGKISVTTLCANSWTARIANTVKRNEGTTAVEFAIILPVFLILLMGILSYGIYFGAAHGVAQLAADAARVSVAGLTDTERASLAQQHVASHVEGFAFLDHSKVVTTAAASADDADQFTVAVRFDSSALPIWAFSGIVPLPSKVIERSSSIRRGGQ